MVGYRQKQLKGNPLLTELLELEGIKVETYLERGNKLILEMAACCEEAT